MTSIKLEKALYRAFKDVVKEKGTSISEVLGELIREYLAEVAWKGDEDDM